MSALSTGLELILNACEGVLQIAITDDEKPLCFQEWFVPKRATETLAPALQNIFTLLNIAPKKFRRIACVCGPGSHTGIRLVLTTAAAFRRIGKAQLASLDYMQSLASTAAIMRGLPYGSKIYVLTNAARNLLHFRSFLSYGPQIPAQPLSELELLSPAQALAKFSTQPCHICGSALNKYQDIFNDPYANMERMNYPGPQFMPNLINPNLDALRLLARHGDYFPRDLEPINIRNCDAVENLEDIAIKRGEDPVELLTKLNSILGREIKSMS